MASTLTVNIASRRVIQSNPFSARDAAAQLVLTNLGGLSVANLRAALYRRNDIAATCVSMTTVGATAVGTISTNTKELADVFDIVGVRPYENLGFDLFVYDGSQSVYLFRDKISVQNQIELLPGTPPNVTPITGATSAWGNLRMYNGRIYIQSTDDGLFYPMTAAGSGDTVHEVLDGDGGIVIP